MDKPKIISRDDIKQLDPELLFTSMIGCKGMEYAQEVLSYYYQIEKEPHEDMEFDGQDILEAYHRGFTTCYNFLLGDEDEV